MGEAPLIEAGYENYDKLREAELDMIRLRRDKASCSTQKKNHDGIESDLVGLALSGGGIRSAVFNLGFLQAISQRGFLRYVDYLCSVSGGGYVAGHLAALANSVENASKGNKFHDVMVKDFDSFAHQPSDGERVADLGTDDRGRLTSSYRFREIGNYLFSDVAGMVWRYLLFTSFTVLLIVSLVGVFASSAAYVWRCLDTEIAQDYLLFTGLPELGLYLNLGDETLYAFLPSLVPLALLLLSAFCLMVCHFWRFGRGKASCERWCALWLRCWGVALLISTAVFLGNGETGFSAVQSLDSLTQWQDKWGLPLFGLVVVSLLPLVRFRSVVDSTRPEAPVWKGYLATLLMSFTCGAGPFFMVFWMARENVSEYVTYRDPMLERNDVQDWSAFVQLSATLGCEPGADSARKAQLKERQIEELLYSPTVLGRKGWLSHERLPHQSLSGLCLRFLWLWRLVDDPVSEDLVTRDEDGKIQTARNPIGTYRNLLVFKRELQQQAVDDFNSKFSADALTYSPPKALPTTPSQAVPSVSMRAGATEHEPGNDAKSPHAIDARVPLADPKLAVQLVSIACGVPTHSRPALSWQAAEGDSAKVGLELASRSRDAGNFKMLWRRTLLDSMKLPKESTEKAPIAETTADALKPENRWESESRHEYISRFLLPNLETWNPANVATFNRLLLEALFPEVIRPRNMVSTMIVPSHDQICRRQWLCVWAIMSFILLFIDWNFISPFFVYYRNKLSRSFVDSAALPSANFFDEKADLRLVDLKPWACGAPYTLMLASMHFFRGVSLTPSVRRGIDPPDADGCQPFLLTPQYCGSPFTGWKHTKSYCGGEITLADAVALSGAAVTPFMINSLGMTSLMAMANLRMGQWLPLPERALSISSKPRASGWRIGRELLRSVWSLWSEETPEKYLKSCNMGLIADGGFHDFFGIEELLMRRCRLIVVVDAGCNNGRYEFGALADVLRMMRMKHGVEFLDLDHEAPVELGLLKRDPNTAQQPLHHCCFRARYPEKFSVPDGPSESLIVYAQMSLTGDEELDLQQFRNVNPSFPDEPTTNQRYSADQVESYRQLGYHIGENVCQGVPATLEDGSISATTWGAYFCEAFVQDWRRLAGWEVPLVETHSSGAVRCATSNFKDADASIREFLRDPQLRRTWRRNVLDWWQSGQRQFRSTSPVPLLNEQAKAELIAQANRSTDALPGKRPGTQSAKLSRSQPEKPTDPRSNKSSSAQSGKRPDAQVDSLAGEQPDARQVVYLVLACQSYERPGGDLASEVFFMPGGRARLCLFAAAYTRAIYERAAAVGAEDPTHPERENRLKDNWTRKSILRELRNVAFATHSKPLAPDGTAPHRTVEIPDSVDKGCRMAAILLCYWNSNRLPERRFLSEHELDFRDWDHFEADEAFFDPIQPSIT